jgi:hypothetical protein
MTVPLGAMDLARRAAELKELLDVKRDVWADPVLDALRHRVQEVEAAALDLAIRQPGATSARAGQPPHTPPPTSTPDG